MNDLALGSGIGIVDDNGIAIDQDVLNNNIQAVAHELGHNLGLGHTTYGAGGPENLMTTGGAKTIKNSSIDDTFPDGAMLAQLNEEQIDEVLQNSPFVRTMPLAEGSFTVSVNNLAPEITSLAVNKTLVNEGETLTLGGLFSDPGTADEHEVVIQWGDGSSDTVNLSGERGFTKGHVYSTPGNYQIRVRVGDDDGANSPVETIDIEVNALPIATDDTVQTAEDVSVNIDVLANDSDADGDPLSIVGAFAMNNRFRMIGKMENHDQLSETSYDGNG